MSNVTYSNFEIQPYLKSNSGLTEQQKRLVTNIRTRMFKVRQHFKNQFEDHMCQLCNAVNEDQFHLFNCEKIINNCEELANNIVIEYEDLFETGNKLLEAVKLLKQIVKPREQLMSENL